MTDRKELTDDDIPALWVDGLCQYRDDVEDKAAAARLEGAMYEIDDDPLPWVTRRFVGWCLIAAFVALWGAVAWAVLS